MSGRRSEKTVDVRALRRALGSHPAGAYVVGGVGYPCLRGPRGRLLPRADLAQLVGCSASSIARWERGESPSAKLVQRLRNVEKVVASGDVDDIDSMLVATHPGFRAMIEESRRSGFVSIAQARRRRRGPRA